MTTPIVIELRRNGNYVGKPATSGGQSTAATASTHRAW
jgi:hypothetical protein